MGEGIVVIPASPREPRGWGCGSCRLSRARSPTLPGMVVGHLCGLQEEALAWLQRGKLGSLSSPRFILAP